MYATDLNDKRLTLAVSGMLWEGNLVMVDEETGSLWSQMLGEAMRGPLKGTVLENIPARMTTWSTWKRMYPETTVLFMTRTTGFYDRGFLGPDRGIGIGLVINRKAKFWDYSHMNRNPVINDQFEGTLILAVIDQASLTPALYSRRLEDRVLNFEWVDGQLIDKETKSTWDVLTGAAIAGELAGEHLQQLPGFTSDAAAWSLYFPNTIWWAEPVE